MQPTSEERRKVAAKLRQMSDAHGATEASRVDRALGLEDKVYGTVIAFDSADIRSLADLIDPTCHVVTSSEGTIACDRCHTVMLAVRAKPSFCPNCGARVVRDDDQ